MLRPMAITASHLRADVYRILDEILETGAPVEIERKGMRLRIVAVHDEPGSRLDRLQAHPGAVNGDPDELVHLDWSGEWTP